MILSDIAVTRPVFATVLALLLVIFGIVSFNMLPLREYPDIDPPVVTIETNYRGAAASVIDSQVTQVIEERVAGIEGIEFIDSRSEDGRSRITIRFSINRDVNEAANDIRDRVSAVLRLLPDEADPPAVRKVDANQDVVIWWNLTSDRLNMTELTDYAERFLVDRFSTLDGVGAVRIGGQQRYAMRIWLDREALAARNLTVSDVEDALRSENVELPAGNIESYNRLFTVRVVRSFNTADDFARLVVARGDNYLVRLSDVARVERGTEEARNLFRGNTVPMVGIGLERQSTANTLELSRDSRALVAELNETLPEGMSIEPSFDGSVFIEGAIKEVYSTLAIALVLVVLAIFLFLGSPRAILVPAVTLPVSIVATFSALLLFGFTINLLTLLALVLAIGLVVDDAIIVLENIRRRIDEEGETPLVAAFYGTRQVAFAVVSTTLVLIAVFVPIAFLQGDVGRLFSEFALTMAAAVAFSSFVALTLSAMLASKVLKPRDGENWLTRKVESTLFRARNFYAGLLVKVLRWRWVALLVFLVMFGGTGWLFSQLPTEYTPREDRGSMFLIVNGPEGATYDYMLDYMNEIETRLMELVDEGDIMRLLVRAPRAFGGVETFNTGIVIIVLEDWGERRSGWDIMADIQQRLADLPGVRAFPVMRQGFGGGQQQPFQMVIGGAGSYAELAEWRDTLMEKIQADNPGLINLDSDYKETQPQLEVIVDYDRAADLGVNVGTLGRTLETMLGSRRVTTYIEDGEEYDVILEGEPESQRQPTSLENIYVRSATSGELIPLSNMVSLEEYAGSTTLNRYNRNRAITLEAGLADGVALGDALDHVEALAREHLPDNLVIDYKGQSLDLRNAGGSLLFVFALGLVVVFLVLSAQFESFVHPLVIMFGVPMAIGGALLGLWITGNTLNLYSQIGLVMLIGLAAKNGILIVEFANQLRDAGKPFDEALVEASTLRLRPILMTGVTTVAGALPLVMAFGPGAETRSVIGIVVMSGVSVSMFLTLFVIPVLYSLMARGTGSPSATRQQLEREEQTKGAV
ncbi:MAG: efflux RND transporter permease subunit [Gammaproteobacteria bacterium]|nr:efflux RND transporter permease subunit [Gammaproteobacteria bacterium]